MMDEKIELERDGDEREEGEDSDGDPIATTHDRVLETSAGDDNQVRPGSFSTGTDLWSPTIVTLFALAATSSPARPQRTQRGVDGKQGRQVASRGDHLVVGIGHRALQLGAELVPG